jgi:hypothetical protein
MSGDSPSPDPNGPDPSAVSGLFAARPWPLAAVTNLEGRCKAGLLKDWGLHVARRFGPDEPTQLRAMLGLDAQALPDAPHADRWVPVGWQPALTRLIAERHYGGDLWRLEPLLREDARTRPVGLIERVLRLAVRPATVIAASPKVHRGLYDIGRCDVSSAGQVTTLAWRGARLFEEPTWRILQLFAIRGLCDALGAREPRCTPREIGPTAFSLEVCFSG